jgi:hypothetical protein
MRLRLGRSRIPFRWWGDCWTWWKRFVVCGWESGVEAVAKGIHWGRSLTAQVVPTCLECLPAGTRALGP